MSVNLRVPEPLDPALLARFLEQGAALVAHERGLTPACRIKLAEVARTLGIAESQTEEAIRALTSEPAPPPNPRAERFRGRLRKDLAAASQAVIDPALEAKILAVGRERYGLSEGAASDVLAEVAVELGLTRITASDAIHNLMAQIDQAVGDSTWLAREAWDRLRAAGAKWGVNLEIVDQLIDERLAANRAEHADRGFRAQATLIVAGAAVAIAAVIVAALIVMRSTDSNAAASFGENATVSELPRPSSAAPPDWWDVDLAVEMAQARTRVAALAPTLRQLASSAEGDRANGYERLLEQVRAAPEDTELLAAAAHILAGCYALDPADSAAGRLRFALVGLLPGLDRPLPTRPAEVALSLWAADVAAAALHRPAAGRRESEGRPVQAAGSGPDGSSHNRGRRAALAEALGAVFGGSVELAMSRAEQQEVLRQRTMLAAYAQFSAAAVREPAAVAAIYPALADRATLHLADDEFLRAETALLVIALPAAGEHWTAYERPLARCVASPDPLPALRLLDALRRATDERLVKRLSELLLVRAGVGLAAKSKSEVIVAVRKALGGGASLTASDRWLTLEEEAREALTAPAPSDDRELAARAVQLAHLANLALALIQGEAAFATFDALLAEPPQLEGRAGDSLLALRSAGAARPIRRLSKAQQRDLTRYLSSLGKRGAAGQPERESALRGLAGLAKESTDITPQQAAALADYLLADKSDSEEAKALAALSSLRNWRQLCLAVADALPASKRSIHQQRELAARLLSRDLADEFTADALRRTLLMDVLSDLAGEAALSPTTERWLDTAAERIAASYRQRAVLLGAASSDLALARTPGQALELVLSAAARKVRSKSDDFAQRLAAELTAARYLATGDLDYTIALQRLLVEAASRLVTVDRPQHAAAVRRIAADVGNGEARSALVQLHAQELALLKLWMLYAPES